MERNSNKLYYNLIPKVITGTSGERLVDDRLFQHPVWCLCCSPRKRDQDPGWYQNNPGALRYQCYQSQSDWPWIEWEYQCPCLPIWLEWDRRWGWRPCRSRHGKVLLCFRPGKPSRCCDTLMAHTKQWYKQLIITLNPPTNSTAYAYEFSGS